MARISPLAAPALSMLTSSLAGGIVTVALPALAEAFAAPFQHVQAVLVAYLLVITLLIAGAGTLGDRFGRRRLLIAGLAVFTLASALCSVAPTLPLLVAARALQGLGAALMMALTTALVADAVPAERRGRAMGLLGSTSAVGTSLGPALGGGLVALFGWRAIFAALVPLGLLAAALAVHGLPVDAPSHRRAPMAAGSWRETAAPLWRGLATSLLVSMVMMATLVVGPFYLTQGLGLPAAQVGLVMSVGPAAAALAGVPAGRWVDRIGAGPAVLIGLAGIGAGALGLATQTPGVAGYLAALVTMTLGYALFQAANNTAVMVAAGASRRGAASGWLGLSRQLGLLAGASGMGAVFALAARNGAAAGLHSTFAVAAGAIGVALWVGSGSRFATNRG